MKALTCVFNFTFVSGIKKKSFLISTIIILILAVGITVLPAAIDYFKSNDDTNANTQTNTNTDEQNNLNRENLYIIDSKDLYSNEVIAINESMTEFNLIIEQPSRQEEIIELITENKKNALIVLYEKDHMPAFDFYTNDSAASPGTISSILKNTFVTNSMKEANIEDSLIQKSLSNIQYNVNHLGKSNFSYYAIAYLMLFILFFAVYFYGYMVAMSVAAEKTSRVMEILLTSTKPAVIVIGKTLAMGAIGLIQMLLLIVTVVITFKFTFPDNFVLFGSLLDFSQVTPLTGIVALLYFIFGFLLYAFLNAVSGALVSKAEDVNAAIMPITFIVLIAFYLSYPSVMAPDSKMSSIVSFIPFTSPFSMPSRVLGTDVSGMSILFSLAILIVTTLIVAYISIKVYTAATLHYGKLLKPKEVVRLVKDHK